jgi:hypothetical protein
MWETELLFRQTLYLIGPKIGMSCETEVKDIAFCETKGEGREERKCERDKHSTIWIFVATFNLVF